MIEFNFIKLYEKSFKENWSLPAITNYNSSKTFLYSDVAERVAKVHLALDYIGIQPRDKVALIGKDSAEWCMVYLGVMTYGAIIVPILPDFNKNDILNIIDHSEARVVFVSKSHYSAMNAERLPNVLSVIDIDTLKPQDEFCLNKSFLSLDVEALFGDIYAAGFTPEHIRYKDISNDTIVLINYTSGTTGYSKGVMITANNLAGNVMFAMQSDFLKPNECILCFLPMAHAYSCSFNFLYPLSAGSHLYILGVPPTPKVLSKAFADVKPDLILSVPLILEKIYKNVITPAISKGLPKILLKIPVLNRLVYRKVRIQLYQNLGGRFKELVIGGAALTEEVCTFLHKAKFPFTVGYGMTECAPLITYEHHKKYVPGSCGKPLSGIMEVRISEPDPETGIGEIQCRGENVCKGYFKDEDATKKLFTEDGWLRTGDLGYLEKGNDLFIKGRIKNVLLGPNGQNIYTEAIEAKLSMMPFVSECVVVMNKNRRLVALIYPDKDLMKKEHTTLSQLEELLMENLVHLNEDLSSYEQVTSFVLKEDEFEKTPKKSIKRFLYEHDQENMK